MAQYLHNNTCATFQLYDFSSFVPFEFHHITESKVAEFHRL